MFVFRLYGLWLFPVLLVVSVSRGDDAYQSLPSKSTEPNFRVLSFAGGPTPEDVLRLCELLRRDLGQAWLGKQEVPVWQPRCEVQVHQNRQSYIRAVGLVGEQTLGSSFIQLQDGVVITRRLDLLIDSDSTLPALPHELTHVILADCFGGRQPPHWFDEGAAMLADTLHKQSLHARDCQKALHSGTALPITQLLRLEQFTSQDQMAQFYGQSASLLRFFCQRGGIEKVTRFAIDSLKTDYEQSLQKHYGISSEQELERLWKREAMNQGKIPEPPPILTVSSTSRQAIKTIAALLRLVSCDFILRFPDFSFAERCI